MGVSRIDAVLSKSKANHRDIVFVPVHVSFLDLVGFLGAQPW
jgi:hypothetical protein